MIKSIQFRSLVPSDQPTIAKFNNNVRTNDFVSFSITDASAICYQNIIVGFFRIIELEIDPIDYEVLIGIFPEYQRMGFAQATIEQIENNLFASTSVRSLRMKIDIENQASINLAQKLGFRYDDSQKEEYAFYNDKHTQDFIKWNPLYEKDFGRK